MRLISRFCVLAAAVMCAACAQIADTGPGPRDIFQHASTAALSPAPSGFAYALIDVTANVVEHAIDIDPGSFFRSYGEGRRPAPEILVGKGDILQLTIFESKSGGLFIPDSAGARPGNFVQLPSQIVGHDGYIEVPYAGRVSVAGHSLAEIESDVEHRLANRAIEPKVIAAFTEQNATTVSVVGEVYAPKKVRITQGGERILDMIALAGGIRFPGYETYVTLQRGGQRATVYFNTLISRPEENIFTKPRDTIYVYREPRRFIVFGAVSSATAAGSVSQQINFEQERVSLAEGVAKAGGLIDDRANPGMIFLYRVEPREILRSMGVDLSTFPPDQREIPAIYRANFRDPTSYFSAQKFPLRGRDIIYVSNSDSVEVTKVLTYISTITSTVSGVTTNVAATRGAGTYIGRGSANPLP